MIALPSRANDGQAHLGLPRSLALHCRPTALARSLAVHIRLNELTAAFVERFCDDGIINWERLINFNSGKASPPGSAA